MPVRSATRREARFSGRLRDINRAAFRFASPVTAGDGGFGRQTLPPEVAAQMASDFVEAFAFDLLQDDAAVAN